MYRSYGCIHPHKPGYIFADEVKFEVDAAAREYRPDIGVLKGVRDDGDVEGGSGNIKDGEADAVEADGAFFYDEMAKGFGEFEPEFPAAVEFPAFRADGGGVGMSLDDMAVEAAVHFQASFQVDEIARLPVVEVGLGEGLFDGGDAVTAGGGGFGGSGTGWVRAGYGWDDDLFDGEADAVMGDALVDLKFLGDRGFYPKCFIGAFGFDGYYFSERFDNSGKHRGEFRKICS